jgi:hypothetical protein
MLLVVQPRRGMHIFVCVFVQCTCLWSTHALYVGVRLRTIVRVSQRSPDGRKQNIIKIGV